MRIPKTRVFVISDSTARRKELTDAIWTAQELELIGGKADPFAVLDPESNLQPDVVLLDAGPSRVDTSMLLRRLGDTLKVPVVVVADGATLGSSLAIDLLQAGAIDVFCRSNKGPILESQIVPRLVQSLDLCRRLRKNPPSAPASKAPSRATGSQPTDVPKATAPRVKASGKASLERPRTPKPVPTNVRYHPRQLLVIGASTGGTEAIRDVLLKLPGNLPGICIVQHIPAAFSRAFANRLNDQCEMEVREAADGDVVRPGLALIAPGGFHMEVSWRAAQSVYVVRLQKGPQEHHQRPAVDVLFRTAAAAAGPHLLGVILTGMGKDGALGMKAIREAGGYNIGQDEASSVVFGMPAAAQQLGVVDHVAGLTDVPQAILRRLNAPTALAAA